MNETLDCTKIEVGQWVWICDGHWSNKHNRVKKVIRLSDTIIFTGQGEYEKYRRQGGRAWRRFGRDYISELATEEDFKAYQKSIADKNAAYRAREAEQEALRTKEKELSSLFGDRGIVRAEDGKWNLTFIELSEQEIREFALTVMQRGLTWTDLLDTVSPSAATGKASGEPMALEKRDAYCVGSFAGPDSDGDEGFRQDSYFEQMRKEGRP